MNILDQIVAQKRLDLEHRKLNYPIKSLEKAPFFERTTYSLKKALTASGSSGVIAEFKRRSPSRGTIRAEASVETITTGYVRAGAAALSVLTDGPFFGGRNFDLVSARALNECPILRKDFILEEYQILEAKSIGADAILLIAACLKPKEVKTLSDFAISLGLEVLVELREEAEINHLPGDHILAGVNNRNLRLMKTDLQTSFRMASLLPEMTKVSESGLDNPEIILELKQAGYHGFLIGEYFMQSGNPETTCHHLIQSTRS
jgi:indole-3-glycerol phosphate synthase